MKWPDRETLHEIIFEADTPAGKAFDVALLAAIVFSVLAVILETVETIAVRHGPWLRASEWCFTLLFTVEYFLRLYCVRRRMRYAASFFGLVDLLSILPLYVSLFWPGAQTLLAIRVLRMLRVFRVFKVARFLGEANVLKIALSNSVPKVIVFLGTVLTFVVVIGAVMHLVEGDQEGFANIPKSMYWAIVTLTTVGYGDIVPVTVTGRFLAALVMVLGFGIIAVPTGIVSAEIVQESRRRPVSTQACRECSAEGHDIDAKHCKYCGAAL
ncbi:MAG: ion transporter [Planctomycetota bacterium]